MTRRTLAPRGRRFAIGVVVASAATLLCAAPLAAQNQSKPTSAAIIPITGEINDIVFDSIERRVSEARADGATTIVFEMDTPGGLVTSALNIVRLIKKLPDEGIRTVAWVHDEAFSAGALISVATQEILISRAGSIGDCAPIMISQTGELETVGDTERAKIESPILQSFRDSAIVNGYDPLLCRAMVTVGVEVWWVEHVESGERQFVDSEKKTTLIDNLEPEAREWRLVEEYRDSRTGKAVPVDQPIDREDALLTLSENEAIAYGFASAVVSNLADLKEQLQIVGDIPRLEATGWEKFAIWLNSPLVRGILFVLVLLGGYIEFQSPGLILPGAVALISLAVFLGAPYAAGLADIWTIILLLVGVILLAVEIFIIPGFGIAGVSGILLILVAFVGTFVPTEPGMPPLAWPNLAGTWEAIKTGIMVLASSVIIAITGIALLARFLPTMPLGRGVVLGAGESANAEAVALADAHPNIALVGDVGIVTGDLRPGGQARFGRHIVDVHSQGEYVDAGRRVQVIERDGFQITVRPLPDEA